MRQRANNVAIILGVMLGLYICAVLPRPGPRAWEWSQGASGRSQRNGSSGPGPRVFDIAPILGNEQLSHPLSGPSRRADPMGCPKIVKKCL